MKTTVKYIVHWNGGAKVGSNRRTFKKLQSAVEFLGVVRNAQRRFLEENTDFTAERIIENVKVRCYIEKQVVTSERMEF